jgi:anti-sigma factor RsiW
MTCKNPNIKELLPAYREQGLDQSDQDRVRKHLEACGDCRTELSLLRMMAEEAVPDPGDAFWAEMPDRVFRAVQKQKALKWHFDLSWLAERLILPRWTIAAATIALVLAVSLLAGRSFQKSPGGEALRRGQPVDEVLVADSGGTVSMNDLDGNQLETISDWAGKELDSIAEEAGPVMANNADTDIYEELANLDTGEAEHLSAALDQWEQEGS